MPFFLRGIRKARWYKDFKALPWIKPPDLPADPLADLVTQDNRLSVYLIEDDKANLKRVVAALAATREPSNYDYALFKIEDLENANIHFQIEPGTTPDHLVNTWHYDISQLSANGLITLLKCVWEGEEKSRISEKEILSLVRQGISLEQINQSKVNANILKKLRS